MNEELQALKAAAIQAEQHYHEATKTIASAIDNLIKAYEARIQELELELKLEKEKNNPTLKTTY